jgi:(1->4)-alpha-D-glucan 1-alpha-D-glucosylmutase
LYIVVEKILNLDESLPPIWPIQGTTGYDFTNYVNELFIDKNNAKKIDHLYCLSTGLKMAYDLLLTDRKRLMISKYLAGEIDNIAHLIKRVSGKDRKGTDITMYGLRRALVELMTFFPVYRSYINSETFSPEDRMYLQKAIFRAKQTDPGLRREFDFIERFLLLKHESYASEEERKLWVEVVMRFQQFTGPLMAKGFEDTLLYDYNRLISLNEVGGWPQVLGISENTFHAFNIRRMHSWPNTINTTSTHDTKRGEDVRARINVLSELPDQWEHLVKKWMALNRPLKVITSKDSVPDANDEYFLYQTLIGAFPLYEKEYKTFVTRIQEYMLKSIREAKVHTEWIVSDFEYEKGIQIFIDRLLDIKKSEAFFEDFLPFQEKVAWHGLLNSLSQCLLKITSPGLPDFYQGTELWDLNLVDPDNRRKVDFEERRRLVFEVKGFSEDEYPRRIPELFKTWKDGQIKLLLIIRGLACRNDFEPLFLDGVYIPLTVDGQYKENVIAFARMYQQKWAIIAAPRLTVSVVGSQELPLADVWKDTVIHLPRHIPERWSNAITGETLRFVHTLPVSKLFTCFPGAILVSKN